MKYNGSNNFYETLKISNLRRESKLSDISDSTENKKEDNIQNSLIYNPPIRSKSRPNKIFPLTYTPSTSTTDIQQTNLNNKTLKNYFSVNDNNNKFELNNQKNENNNNIYQGDNINQNLNFISQTHSSYKKKVFINKSIHKNLSYSNFSDINNLTEKTSQISLSNYDSDYLINLEDLMQLEEKLDEIIQKVNTNLSSINECFEWWNFYFNCSLCGKLENYFNDEMTKSVIKEHSHLELLTIIICYDSSHDLNLLDNIILIEKSILNLLYQNFLIICNYILSKVVYESKCNMWVNKLNNLIETKMTNFKIHKNQQNSYSLYSEIKSNNSCISDFIRIILNNYSKNSEVKEIILVYFKNINKINLKILNEFFRTKVIRVINQKGSILATSLKFQDFNKNIKVPYLSNKSNKEYTLVLDLDETLIHFKLDNLDQSKGLLRLRPGLYDFLDYTSKSYELIIFTASTQDYADPILDAIDQDRIYFDYRLYRQHTIISENDFVKDISKIGRDLSKMIIIDNMPQNFRLQKENGIFIRTFYGEDQDDSALEDLIPILVEITEMKVKDVRFTLRKYKDLILNRISSHLNKHFK